MWLRHWSCVLVIGRIKKGRSRAVPISGEEQVGGIVASNL
jgi:hypothetical protein